MEFKKILEILEILKESIKAMSRNGRVMALITSIYLLLYSLFFLLNIFSIKPLIYDIFTKTMALSSIDPQGPLFVKTLISIQEHVKTLFGFELVLILSFFAVSIFAQTATILIMAISYKDNTIFAKDLLVKVPRPSARLLITVFFVHLLSIGFTYFSIMVVMTTRIILSNHIVFSKVISWVLGITIVCLYLYLSVVWVMALVVSVLEESCGIQALGRAGRLVKGKRLEGFVLTFLVNLLSSIFVHVIFKGTTFKQTTTQAIFGMLMVCFICLVFMFEIEVYTVLYFKCKKNHGEDIELQESIEYSKIPSIP